MPQTETWFTWKQFAPTIDPHTGNQEEPRLLTPHADPHEYEYPFDFLYETAEAAVQALKNAIDNEEVTEEEAGEWYLCRETTQPIVAYKNYRPRVPVDKNA